MGSSIDWPVLRALRFEKRIVVAHRLDNRTECVVLLNRPPACLGEPEFTTGGSYDRVKFEVIHKMLKGITLKAF